MTTDHDIILFYKFVDLENPEVEMHRQKALLEDLGMKGRVILAGEGINATLEGTKKSIDAYIETMNADARFAGIHWKRDEDTPGDLFPRLSVKVRDEIISTHLGDEETNPNEITGNYLSPEELHQWYESGKDFVVVDMRNDYEYKVGHFEGSVLPSLKNFRDLKKILPEIEHLKDKTVLTVCTGGVRCEKASGYLMNQGFKDVHQLEGGIVSYMKKYPNKNFVGKLYVFDGRVTWAIEEDSSEHKVIGTCERCGVAADTFGDCANMSCNKHMVCCADCREPDAKVYCSPECKQKVLA